MFRSHGMARRLFAFLFVSLAAGFGAFAYLSATAHIRQLESELTAAGNRSADLVVRSADYAMLRNQRELLTRMITAIGLTRESVYIANVIKCRPPGNRDPQPEEVAACQPHLLRQIRIIRPAIICTLGRFAAQTLLQTDESMGKLRGRLFEYNGIKLIPTYHPAALLRNEQWKRPTWEDLKRLRLEYDGVTV